VLSGIEWGPACRGRRYGKLGCPVDFAIRRPDPTGLGRRAATNCTGCRAGGWTRGGFRRRGVALPHRWSWPTAGFSDSKLMRHVTTTHQGTVLVEGKVRMSLRYQTGARSRGRLAAAARLAVAVEPQVPGVRLCAAAGDQSNVCAVTLIVVEEPGENSSMSCASTRYQRRGSSGRGSGAIGSNTVSDLEALVGDGACQVHSERRTMAIWSYA